MSPRFLALAPSRYQNTGREESGGRCRRRKISLERVALEMSIHDFSAFHLPLSLHLQRKHPQSSETCLTKMSNNSIFQLCGHFSVPILWTSQHQLMQLAELSFSALLAVHLPCFPPILLGSVISCLICQLLIYLNSKCLRASRPSPGLSSTHPVPFL